MDDEDFDEEIQRTIQLGVENLELIKLGEAWCQNIGTTKGPMSGTGIIESMYGLPVNAGSFRCDFANAPTSFGMRLEWSALEFYEKNCVGCPHRKPTSATEHLGTWAEERIARRVAEEAQEAERTRVAGEARTRRSEQRRLLLGAPNPALLSILDLIDEIDQERPADNADQLLVRHAEMSPDDFPNALIDHLVGEAIAIRSGALLEAVIAVFERQGRPDAGRMVTLAFEAIADGIGREPAGRVISSYATDFDVDPRALTGIVHLAAGDHDIFNSYRRSGDPAAVLRFYDVDPKRLGSVLGSKLRDDEPWIRADAAHATKRLIRARPTAGRELLPALLDAIALPDGSKYAGDPYAAATAQQVVSELLLNDAAFTSRKIDERMQTADLRYAKKLWRCFDKAVSPYRDEHKVPGPLSAQVASRAVRLLKGSSPVELLEDVSSSLKGLAEDFPGEFGVNSMDLLRLHAKWRAREREEQSAAPDINKVSSVEELLVKALQRDVDRMKVGSVRARLGEALQEVAKSDPTRFIDDLEQQGWKFATKMGNREPVIEALGAAVADQTLLDRADPFLTEALNGGDVIDRAAALEALDEIAGKVGVALSDEMEIAIFKAAADEKLLVFRGALRALRRVNVPPDAKPELIQTLLAFAKIYGPQRLYDQDVERAVRLVLKLSAGEAYEDRAQELLLDVIGGWPSAESAELLDRLQLDEHRAWPAAAVAALRVDPDPQYYSIHDHDRVELLKRLSKQGTERLTPYMDALEEIAIGRLPEGRMWAWAIADVLAHHGEFERALRICEIVVSQIPQTQEHSRVRGLARQVALSQTLALAKLDADEVGAARVRAEWTAAGSGEDD